MSWNGVISVGDDRRDWPRSSWGSRDRAQAAREDRVRAELNALTREPEREFKPLPVQAPNPMGGFSLYAKPRRRGETYRSREVDRLIDSVLGRR